MNLVAEAEGQRVLVIGAPPLPGQAADCGEGERAAGQSCLDGFLASCLPQIRGTADTGPLPQISPAGLLRESPRPQTQPRLC